MLEWLDGKLLSIAQKFCDRFQELTGLTKYRLEKWAAILVAVFFCLTAIFHGNTMIMPLVLIFVAFLGIGVWLIDKAEADFLMKGVVWPSLLYFFPFRFGCAMNYGLLGLYATFTMESPCTQTAIGTAVSMIGWIYFTACVPRPPSKSKAREWYEKGLTWLNDRLKPAVPARNSV